MKCNNCGSEIEEGNDFCPICGVRILNYDVDVLNSGCMEENAVNEQVQMPIEKNPSGQMQQHIEPAPDNRLPDKAHAKKDIPKALLVVLVLLVFSVVAGGVCFIGYTAFKTISENADFGSVLEGDDAEKDKAEDDIDKYVNKGTGLPGKNMISVNGIICNSAGAVNETFKGTISYEFYTDPEGEVGVLIDDGEAYLIDSSLNVTLIDKGCTDVVMNYTGEYIYMGTSEESKLGKGLCVYDVAKNEYSLIKECNITESFCIAVSPDGKTALVSRDDGVFMMGLDGLDEKIYDPRDIPFHVYGVSDDRTIAYFSAYCEHGIYCWNEGELVKVYSAILDGAVAFNSDCKKILFKPEEKGLYYFDPATMTEKKEVFPYKYILAQYKGKEFICEDEVINYFPEAESFEGMYLVADHAGFWLNADMETIRMDNSIAQEYSGADFTVYDYDVEALNAITYKDGETKTEAIYQGDRSFSCFAVSDDDSVVWISVDDTLFMYKDGALIKEALHTTDAGIVEVMNDPLSDKIYAMDSDGKLYMIDENGEVTELAIFNESSSLWQRVYHGKRMIFVSDGTEEIEYVILINGWLIKKD